MAVIVTSNHPKALWPGVYAWFGMKYNEHVTQYTDLFEMKNSSQNYEESVASTGFPLAVQKSEGSGVAYADHNQEYVKRYIHVAYALGFIVTEEEIDDNLYKGKAFDRAGALAFSMRQTKEVIGANVYNNATTAGYIGGDGKVLLATGHTSQIGDQSNKLATAADLSEASLEDLLIQMSKAKNSRGLRIAIKPKNLIIPPDLVFEANRILKSTLQNDTANNAINALKATNALPGGITMNNYLTDTDQWFIRTDVNNGMCCFDRKIKDLEQDNDFDTGNAKTKKYERYSFGWTDWRGIYGSEGA